MKEINYDLCMYDCDGYNKDCECYQVLENNLKKYDKKIKE